MVEAERDCEDERLQIPPPPVFSTGWVGDGHAALVDFLIIFSGCRNTGEMVLKGKFKRSLGVDSPKELPTFSAESSASKKRFDGVRLDLDQPVAAMRKVGWVRCGRMAWSERPKRAAQTITRKSSTNVCIPIGLKDERTFSWRPVVAF